MVIFVTVKQLKDALQNFDDNMEVVISPTNSIYLYDVRSVGSSNVNSFWSIH